MAVSLVPRTVPGTERVLWKYLCMNSLSLLESRISLSSYPWWKGPKTDTVVHHLRHAAGWHGFIYQHPSNWVIWHIMDLFNHPVPQPCHVSSKGKEGGSVLLVLFLFAEIYLFIYLWLHWVFVAVRGLSLVVESGGYSSLQCTGFSWQWLLLLRSTGSRHTGFSSCGMWAQ